MSDRRLLKLRKQRGINISAFSFVNIWQTLTNDFALLFLHFERKSLDVEALGFHKLVINGCEKVTELITDDNVGVMLKAIFFVPRYTENHC